jgi:coniferyl-aldehyde dehydrogenase
MNAPAFPTADIAIPAEFRTVFDTQRAAYLKAPERTQAERVADLKALVRLVRDNQAAIVAAISTDFGNRSEFETKFAEIFVVIDSAHDAAKRLAHWMRPQRRPVDLMVFAGARNRLIPQPLGVVGVIVPWNYPLMLSFGPLISIFAAGNRAMVKMSENSRRLSELLIEVSPKYFPEDKLAFFDDGGGRGPAFSSLPFDHLIFTGSGKTGRAVMASAALNLTPVTLELGGKSPAIVAPDFPVKTAAERILWAKTLNAGQTCTAVDYVFLPRAKETEFVDACKRLIAKRYPDINGPDFTSIIDERAYDRLTAALEDARVKGATLVNLAEGQTPDASKRKFPPHIVLHPTPDMEVMQREIFGPILPIRVYDQPQEVADAINAGDRPLALYPFTHDRATRDFYISRVLSGGVSVNEAILHVGQHSLPFGGVGASGMGHYHGPEGFETFSKMRPVFQQGPVSSVQMMMQPPYSGLARRMIDFMIRMRS